MNQDENNVTISTLLLAILQKTRSSSRRAKDRIACVIIATLIGVVLSRVILSPNALPTVVNGVNIKLSITAEIGIFQRVGGEATNRAGLWPKTDYAEIMRPVSKTSAETDKNLVGYRHGEIEKDWEMEFEKLAILQKTRSSSKIAKDRIACVIIATLIGVVLSRVILSHESLI